MNLETINRLYAILSDVLQPEWKLHSFSLLLINIHHYADHNYIHGQRLNMFDPLGLELQQLGVRLGGRQVHQLLPHQIDLRYYSPTYQTSKIHFYFLKLEDRLPPETRCRTVRGSGSPAWQAARPARCSPAVHSHTIPQGTRSARLGWLDPFLKL